MHRFYMVQSFTRFHRNVRILCLADFMQLLVDTSIIPLTRCLGFSCQVISPAALFLAAKVEEQPRKLEHVIKVAHACLNPQEPSPDVRSDVSVELLCVLRDDLWRLMQFFCFFFRSSNLATNFFLAALFCQFCLSVYRLHVLIHNRPRGAKQI